MQDSEYLETYASVVKPMSYKALFAIAAAKDYEIEQMDVKTAFLYGELSQEEPIYMEQPDGFTDGTDNVCLLLKALYGLRQSPRIWYATLTSYLELAGFTTLDADMSVFVKGETFIAVYVDDLLIVGPHISEINSVKKHLSDRFQMSDLGPCHHYLGMTIRRNRATRTIHLGQRDYIEQFLKKHDMWNNVKIKAIPMDPSRKLLPASDGYQSSTTFRTKYQSAVGSLMYAMLGTRPDIAYAVSVVSRFASNPTNEHYAAVEDIFRYLRGTIQHELTFTGELTTLQGYTDSDWAGDTDTRRSTAGYTFNLGSGAITWSSKRQPTVALSTCEAELMGQTQACKEAVWLRRLLEQLGEQQAQATVIFGDNVGAIALAKNPQAHHARSKHIPIQERWQHEKIENEEVDIQWTPTNRMVADGLTKPLPKPAFVEFRKALGVQESAQQSDCSNKNNTCNN